MSDEEIRKIAYESAAGLYQSDPSMREFIAIEIKDRKDIHEEMSSGITKLLIEMAHSMEPLLRDYLLRGEVPSPNRF